MPSKEFKEVSVPIANHGLHPHSFNYPYVGTGRFMELFPVYYEPLLKKQTSHLKGGFYSLLQPLAQSAFFTGRYHFKGVFVPYTFVFKPWYEFMEGKKYHCADGSEVMFGQAPTCSQKYLSRVFCNLSNGFVTQVSNPVLNDEENRNFDIYYLDNTTNDVHNFVCLKLTAKGARVLKILNSLGISPTWLWDDEEPVLLIDVLCYIKAFLDIYFPGQYVNTKRYSDISQAIKPESASYDDATSVLNILNALNWCSTIFYDKSIFDYCWDTPSGPNSAAIDKVKISDQTFAEAPSWDDTYAPRITNDSTLDNAAFAPKNGAYIANPPASAGSQFVGRITQFGLQALNSIANFMRRNQLAGTRLLEKYLAEHGFSLDNLDAQKSFVIGDDYVEIEISSVENNSNVNLGELAGKGVASTKDRDPIEFECKAEHDGVFIVFCSIEPDCEMPVYNDAYNSRKYRNDFYHGDFDKLGVEGVRQISAFTSMDGSANVNCKGKLFGFLNRYFGDVQEKPRLVGDFRLATRGAYSLRAFHSLRTFAFGTVLNNNGLYHSFDFIDGANDMDQYQRVFYSDIPDNLLLYIRWYGENMKHKLPLGDSFYWSDDEFNKKVKILNQGMRK